MLVTLFCLDHALLTPWALFINNAQLALFINNAQLAREKTNQIA